MKGRTKTRSDEQRLEGVSGLYKKDGPTGERLRRALDRLIEEQREKMFSDRELLRRVRQECEGLSEHEAQWAVERVLASMLDPDGREMWPDARLFAASVRALADYGRHG